MSLTLSDGVIAPHDVSSRRALLCFATGAAVCNYGHGRWASLNMAGADLSRLNSGRALLLSDHEFRLAAVLGVIEAAWIDGDRAFAVARFAGTPAATEAWELVRDRIVSCVSMGFRLDEELEDTTPEAPGIIERWQPIEVSLVTVPANWNAHAFADAPEEEMRRVVSANVDRRGLELTEALQKFQEQSRRDAALSLAPAVAARLGTDPNLTAAALADAAAQ